MEITRRYRVNVGTSVKGVKTYDCTVEINETGEWASEGVQSFQDAILKESDALVAELDKRYPPPIEPASALKPLEK